MCSKKKSNVFRTVKFRVAIWYALLFSLFSTAIFVFIYFFLYASMMKRVDEKLFSFSKKLEDFYLRGEGYENDESIPSQTQIPKEIVSLAQNSVGKLSIIRKEQIMRGKTMLYELTGISAGMVYEIKIDKKGRIVETEKHPINETEMLEKKFVDETRYEGVKKLYFLLASPGEKILAKSDLSSWPRLKVKREMLAGIDESGKFRTSYNSKLRCRVRIFDRRIFDNNVLEVGAALSMEEKLLTAYSSIFLSIFVVSLLFGSITGWVVAGKSMKGVDRVSKAAAISAGQGDFSRRVPYGREGEEIENLVIAFNDMLSKIESLIRELKEITDNIAHDLRTPLTRIRGTIETTVNGNPSLSDYREMAGEIIEECDRLVGMINTMLEITRADSGMLELSMSGLDLSEMTQTAYRLFSPLAEMKNIDFKLDLPKEPLIVSGDTSYLQRVLANLLDNAIKYTPEKGAVLLSASSDGGFAKVAVSDTGCGIAKENQPKVFDRFYRCDTSRSQPGNGLGLSLALAIVKAHSGTITVESFPGKGSAFTICLPRLRQPKSATKTNLRNIKLF